MRGLGQIAGGEVDKMKRTHTHTEKRQDGSLCRLCLDGLEHACAQIRRHYDDVPSSIGIAFERPHQAQALLVVCVHDLAAGEIRQEDAAWGQPALRGRGCRGRRQRTGRREGEALLEVVRRVLPLPCGMWLDVKTWKPLRQCCSTRMEACLCYECGCV